MTTLARLGRFHLVGALGVGVQLGCVAVLVHGAGVAPVPATVLGVTAALAHNCLWHVRWTWRERTAAGRGTLGAVTRFLGANGLVSLAGSALLIPILVDTCGLPAVAANLVAIAACGTVNFWVGDRFCFRAPPARRGPAAARFRGPCARAPRAWASRA